MFYWLIALIIIVPFGFVNIFGAPYLPTLKKEQDVVFGLVKLNAGDLVVDLGSGDGTFLINAAERGYRVVGYESNPYLVLISKWRLRKYGDQAQVRLKNFWNVDLPEDTALLFVFLRTPFMEKLESKLVNENFKGTLVSNSFELPTKKPSAAKRSMFVYNFLDS